MEEKQKISTTSLDLQNEHLSKLKLIFPQFVKEGTIDFDALQNFFEKEGIVTGPEKYGLNWAGRSDAFKAIRVPSTGTLTPEPEQSKNWEETENIFIEGDNLEVLKLLQKHYREKIKMIYIDPPYNTGKDFVYKDNFTQGVADYYEQTGQTKDGIKMTANTEKNGRYHSDWLTMMYPRLFLARNLLKDDGVIFVSIDDNEVASLRLIMDEIFGEENMLSTAIWQKKIRPSNKNESGFSSTTEYIMCYAKTSPYLFNEEKLDPDYVRRVYKNPDEDSRGEWRSKPLWSESNTNKRKKLTLPDGRVVEQKWFVSQSTLNDLYKENRIIETKDGSLNAKVFLSEITGKNPMNLLLGDMVGTTEEATNELKDLFDDKKYFDYSKPLNLMKKLIFVATSTSKKDIVLDFFAGSGTTAHAVMDLNPEDEGNRKWICVQLPEETDEKSEAYKAGYKNIAEISRERIRLAGEKIGKGDIGFKSFKLSNSNYRKWNELGSEDDTEAILKESKLFIEKPLVDGYNEKSVVYEILEKEGFNLNAEVSKEKGELEPWVVVEGERKLVVTFIQKVSKENVDALKLSEHDIFVCFDNALDDTIKVNIGRNVNLKVI